MANNTRDVEFYNFSGGVNYADSEFVLLPTELSHVFNMLPTERGALKVRKGMATYNDTTLGDAYAIRGIGKLYREAEDGTDVLIVSCASKLWNLPTSGAATDLGLDHDDAANYGPANGGQGRFAQYRDRMYVAQYEQTAFSDPAMAVIGDHPDGSGDLLAWQWGVTTPTKSGTYADAGSGTSHPVGDYKYKFTYWYGEDGAYGESNPGPSVTHTVAGAAEDTTVTLWADDADHQFEDWDEAHDAGVDKVYVYRTKKDADVYYYAGEATSGLTWLDNVIDANLDDTTEPPSDNFAPDHAKYLCGHEERMFTAWLEDSSGNVFPKRVRWSLAGYPDIFPNLYYVDAPSEHGDIMGMAELNGILYVFFESAIGALRVYSESEAEFRIVSNEVGPVAARTLAVGNDGGLGCVFYLGVDFRVYRFDGSTSIPISRKIEPALLGEETWISPAAATLYHSAGGWDGQYYHLFPFQASNDNAFWMFRYDTKARVVDDEDLGTSVGTWWVTKIEIGTNQAQSGFFRPRSCLRLVGGADKGELLTAGHPAGVVVRMDIGYSDDYSLTHDAQPIEFHAASGRYNLGLAGYVKAPTKLLVDKESADDVDILWEGGLGADPSESFASVADDVRTEHFFGNYMPSHNFKYTFSGTSTDDDSLPVIYGFVQRFTILREG